MTSFLVRPAFAGFLGLDKVVNVGEKVVKAQAAPEPDEATMGRDLAALVLGAFPPAGSEALNQYVSKVGLTVAQVSSRPNVNYHFQVVDARDAQGNMIVNAFSCPGGYIFVTRGLLSQLKSEAELAGVLGHEIAHVADKHALKAIKKSQTTAALTEAGADIAADQAGVGGGLIKKIGPVFVNHLFEKGFDRADEYKADAAAIQYAAKAGYDPKAFISFLNLLKNQEGGRNYSTIMRTHPKPQDRIDRLQSLMASKNLGSGTKQILANRWQANASGS